MAFGNLVAIEIDVNHLRPWGKHVAQIWEYLRHNVGAAHQVDIALAQNRAALKAKHVTGCPLVERVGLAHIQLTRIGFPHLSPEQFGHPSQLRLGTGIGHPIADKDHRLLCHR